MSTAKRNRIRYTIVFAVLIAMVFVLLVLNINTGNVNISPGRILQILFTGQGEQNELNIIFKIRLPRLIMAGMLGGALALAGFLLQTFFANPIAGPFVLGISSGAKMVVALVMIYFLDKVGKVSSFALVLAAFVGAMMSTLFILLISHFLPNMSGLLVAGIMIGYICSAVTEFLITFAEDADIVNLHGWSQGSFSGMDFGDVASAGIIVGIAFLLTFFLSKPIGAFQMGENYARSMGVNVKSFRICLILLSSLLAACVTAYAGPISFVGIAVPFLMKRCLNTAKPIVVIPAAFLGGAVFCMLSDLIARTAFAPTELNISTVTSLFGAPIVIYMLIQRKAKNAQ
ncbi:MAG: iron ABC transporter permease [Lachnospiraceae bacterium]|nr:iron ABC transporter permease [Lachnospiraceae bacterium]